MPEAALAASVGHALARATELLDRAGCDTPRLDAELLLAETLGAGRERLVLEAASDLDAEAQARFDRLIARRRAREPVAYILGRKPFRHLVLGVDGRALVPRPETELLVEVGLALPDGVRVVDVGTGSGAIALALKHERPDLDVWATDLSEGALELARENAAALGLEIHLAHADLLDRLPVGVDAVLANLPYVAEGVLLPAEIARYEPAEALFAGADGLDVIRRLVPMLDGVSLAALEIGVGQAGSVGSLLTGAGFESTEVLRDLAGYERVVVGRR